MWISKEKYVTSTYAPINVVLKGEMWDIYLCTYQYSANRSMEHLNASINMYATREVWEIKTTSVGIVPLGKINLSI